MFEPVTKCVIGEECEEHNCVHGFEAEELRSGVELLIEEAEKMGVDGEELRFDQAEDLQDAYNLLLNGLRELLESVDASDSVIISDQEDVDADAGKNPRG